MQERNYKSFDDYVKKELKQFKKFLANDGLETLLKESDDYYEFFIRGRWKFLLKSIYHFHLERWLSKFRQSDILIIDGDMLKTKPWHILKEVQLFLNVPLQITEKSFVINPETGFYCFSGKSERHCLDNDTKEIATTSSDFNITLRMTDISKNNLNEFFKPYDKQLFNLTRIPFTWMQ